MQTPFDVDDRLHVCRPARAAFLALLLSLAACQTLPPAGDTAVILGPVPAEAEVSAQAARFIVDPEASEIRLLVYRSGPLARFGHNHVITGPVRGAVLAGAHAADSGFRMEIPLASLAVDPPAARAEEGEDFAAEVSAEARQATRGNMLGQAVLDAASHPLIEVSSIAAAGPRWNPTVYARVALGGATRNLRFRAAVAQHGDLLYVVAGFRIRQSDFGLTPFAVLGGGLQVRDAIDIRVRLTARRAP
jgi:hypothetical protein